MAETYLWCTPFHPVYDEKNALCSKCDTKIDKKRDIESLWERERENGLGRLERTKSVTKKDTEKEKKLASC